MLWFRFVAATAAVLAEFATAQTSAKSSAKALPFPASCSGVTAFRFPYGLADGWQATKLLGGLRQPRTVIFDTNGNMLVLQATTGVSVHTFGANGCVNSTKMLISNRGLNHGLSLTPDGKTLYASSETTAWSWSYDSGSLAATNQQVVVRGMATGIHSTRTLLVVPQAPNLLVLAVGSNNNWDYQAGSASTGRACVKVFDMSKMPTGGYSYNTQGYQLGYGMRNEVGLAFDPAGNAWGVENSGDDFRRTAGGAAVDIHQDNPAEELNYLGDPTKPNNNWYGYPTCFTVWEPSLIRDAKFKVGDQFVVTPNSSFTDSACASRGAIPPRLSFMAHSAPITNIFDADGKNMYVTFHGSWDRQPATGYKVVQVPFTRLSSGEFDPVAKADSQAGYKDILWAKTVTSCQSSGLTQSNCFRLSGLNFDPAFSKLFVTSDNASEGEIYILKPPA